MVTSCQQPSDRLAEIDEATSVQDLDDVGSVFGSPRMSFETLDSPIPKGLMQIMNPEFKRKVQVSEELQAH